MVQINFFSGDTTSPSILSALKCRVPSFPATSHHCTLTTSTDATSGQHDHPKEGGGGGDGGADVHCLACLKENNLDIFKRRHEMRLHYKLIHLALYHSHWVCPDCLNRFDAQKDLGKHTCHYPGGAGMAMRKKVEKAKAKEDAVKKRWAVKGIRVTKKAWLSPGAERHDSYQGRGYPFQPSEFRIDPILKGQQVICVDSKVLDRHLKVVGRAQGRSYV